MISALPPGKLALTEMVGKSTCGRGDTGKTRYARIPANAIPTVIKVVATGRRMNGAEMFMPAPSGLARYPVPFRSIYARSGVRDVKKDVDDGRGVERKHLTEDQSTHHRDAKRTP